MSSEQRSVAIIPARLESSRLPRKALAEICGMPMIVHVYKRCLLAETLDDVYVATDSTEIKHNVERHGGKVIMTSPDHQTGTDRLAEAAKYLNAEIVVNVQGDEPLIPPALINQVAENLALNSGAGISTLCEQIDQVDLVFNPNVVKVIFNQQGFANYFSRAPIPWARESFGEHKQQSILPEGADYFRHIGIYAYKVSFLKNYVTWPPSMTEKVECLEQLRALSNGVGIHVELALETPPAGVDTAEDLERLRSLMSV